MSYGAPDPYNQPEKFDLEIVGDIEWSDESYQFDMTVVWRAIDGTLYYADDSGCSCPSPFEDITSMGDLTPATLQELIDHLNERAGSDQGLIGEVGELMQKVRAA